MISLTGDSGLVRVGKTYELVDGNDAYPFPGSSLGSYQRRNIKQNH